MKLHTFWDSVEYVPNSVKTSYMDGGEIITPNFGNLLYLLYSSQTEFREVMSLNNYRFNTSVDSYISEDTDSCCYSIQKDRNSVVMIFTANIESDIEGIMQNNNIDYTYDKGFKKYSYNFASVSFEIYLQNNPGKRIFILEKT